MLLITIISSTSTTMESPLFLESMLMNFMGQMVTLPHEYMSQQTCYKVINSLNSDQETI